MPDSDEAGTSNKRPFISLHESGILFVTFGIMFLFATPYHLGPSRMRVNEATAAGALKQYVNAQNVFSAKKLAGVPGNVPFGLPEDAYAPNHSTLYYGRNAAGNEIALISKPFADAGFDADAPVDAMTSFTGYVFDEDHSPRISSTGCWPQFALMAFPANSDVSGSRIFWIGPEKRIFAFHPKAGWGHDPADQWAFFRDTPGSTPAVENPVVPWEIADPEWEVRKQGFETAVVKSMPLVFIVLGICFFVWGSARKK